MAVYIQRKSFLLSVDAHKIPEWMTNSVDPDQTPQSAASDLGLHYLLRPNFFGNLG